MRVTNELREQLKLWLIVPVDMTAEKLAEQRKRKKRERVRLKRGKQPRADYLAKSKSKLKPWKAENVSRATWYRRRETGVWPINTLQEDTHLSHPTEPSRTVLGPAGGTLTPRQDQPETEGRADKPKQCQPACTGHTLVSPSIC